MNAALNGEMLEEVECFKYLESRVVVDGGIEREVKFIIDKVGKEYGGMKSI